MKAGGKLTFRTTSAGYEPEEACSLLSRETGLSKVRIKDAMNKGAVWLRRRGRARERLRRATWELRRGDTVELFYDPGLLAVEPPEALCVADSKHFSVWRKPAGLLTQGTDWGDHCSLMRQVETAFSPRRPALPVHRLDREVEGLVVVAHTSRAASELSRLFQKNEVRKTYRVEVRGEMEPRDGIVEEPLDGKPARTRYSVIGFDPGANVSILTVHIDTGRLHQIRRHLAFIGHPVMGDPRYGRGNRDGRPMRLLACGIAFTCPFTGERLECGFDAPRDPRG
ncbi:MAG TPA: RluA family pseudouridine synthase [Deltaproteobacteria bacterium]|nr:RluA family pseudouridine synthase [Deltaproteobacteria bacterium]HPR56512.1 RluA family pseudouridine synthase [Deltaproteobacteria bacterium]HXK46958.1 RluA family pseudouridine synthase [Deltaproteobacteria bacterium]